MAASESSVMMNYQLHETSSVIEKITKLFTHHLVLIFFLQLLLHHILYFISFATLLHFTGSKKKIKSVHQAGHVTEAHGYQISVTHCVTQCRTIQS